MRLRYSNRRTYREAHQETRNKHVQLAIVPKMKTPICTPGCWAQALSSFAGSPGCGNALSRFGVLPLESTALLETFQYHEHVIPRGALGMPTFTPVDSCSRSGGT